MSMNSPMAPESIRALMDMGALLSAVLSCSGMSVPLQSVAECIRIGGSSGMTCSVLGSVVTGDCGVNMSSVDPTVLVSSTENLLVRWGVDFTISDCFGYKAFDVDLVGLSQANLLLLRFQAVMQEVAFLITVIAGVGFLLRLL